MLKELESYDWEEAFNIAAGPEPAIETDLIDTSPFSREDVVEILSIYDGWNDGDSWEILGRLKDGRLFYLTAWCDYTGWDCQADGSSYVANVLDHLYLYCLPMTSNLLLNNNED